jgi:uncharacterized protein
MDAGQILGRGLKFPPRVGADGRVSFSEGETNIREAIEIVLKTEQRERVRLPDFGGDLGRFLFETNSAATHRQLQDRIVRALAAWEPRITVQSVRVEADPGDADAAVATIVYRLVATQALEQVSLSVQLAA